MCHEYWHEQKLQDEAEQKARRDAEEAIRKAKDAKPKTPAAEPAVMEKVPA
jgi:hypothetical protein